MMDQKLKEFSDNLMHTFEEQCFLQLDKLDNNFESRSPKQRLYRFNFFEDIDATRRQYLDRVLCQSMKSLGQQIKNNLRNEARDDNSLDSRLSQKDNTLLLVDLKNRANFTYDKNGVILLKSRDDVKLQAKSVMVQTLFLHIIAKTIKLVQNDNYMTKRELYYLSLEFCLKQKSSQSQNSQSQNSQRQNSQRQNSQRQNSSQSKTQATYSPAKLDNALNELCCILGCSPVHLHIVAQSKGIVYGDLTFKLKSGEVYQCLSRKEGISIPTAQTPISEVESNAKFILIVEKDSIMQKILNQESSSKFIQNYKVILFTARGYPDITSKAFLNFVWAKLKIPILALTDADPHGLEIVCNYKFGSYSSAYEGGHCTLPNIKWLGLLPSDVMKLDLPESKTMPHSPTDLKKIESLLKRPYLRSRATWIQQIELMRDLGQKAELEALDSDGGYLVRTYLPNKLRYASWL